MSDLLDKLMSPSDVEEYSRNGEPLPTEEDIKHNVRVWRYMINKSMRENVSAYCKASVSEIDRQTYIIGATRVLEELKNIGWLDARMELDKHCVTLHWKTVKPWWKFW